MSWIAASVSLLIVSIVLLIVRTTKALKSASVDFYLGLPAELTVVIEAGAKLIEDVLSADSKQRVQDLVEQGQIAFRHEAYMRLGWWHPFEVRIARGFLDFDKELMLKKGLPGEGEVAIECVEVGDVMSVQLVANSDDCEIKTVVGGELHVPADGYANWRFEVRPLRAKRITIEIYASRLVKISGKDVVRRVPAYTGEIRVYPFVGDKIRFFVIENKVKSAALAAVGGGIIAFFSPPLEELRDRFWIYTGIKQEQPSGEDVVAPD